MEVSINSSGAWQDSPLVEHFGCVIAAPSPKMCGVLPFLSWRKPLKEQSSERREWFPSRCDMRYLSIAVEESKASYKSTQNVNIPLKY